MIKTGYCPYCDKRIIIVSDKLGSFDKITILTYKEFILSEYERMKIERS